ncbi:MAG: hypothetical protein HC765_15405 [Brachymonas sp.]|nr:hypothetical protein [Brachymonas sp.]
MSKPVSHNAAPDELLQRYNAAKATLPDGLPDAPSAALRDRIMHAAREQANTIKTIALRADSMPANELKDLENSVENNIHPKDAANDSFWNIKLVASLAVMGLSGLLLWQFENGTPEEREAAQSAQPTISAPAPAAPASPIVQKAETTAPTATAPLAVQKETLAKKLSQAQSTNADTAEPNAIASTKPSPASPTTMEAKAGSGPQETARARISEPASTIAAAQLLLPLHSPSSRQQTKPSQPKFHHAKLRPASHPNHRYSAR